MNFTVSVRCLAKKQVFCCFFFLEKNHGFFEILVLSLFLNSLLKIKDNDKKLILQDNNIWKYIRIHKN